MKRTTATKVAVISGGSYAVFVVLLAIAFWVTVGFVAYHFVSKWW